MNLCDPVGATFFIIEFTFDAINFYVYLIANSVVMADSISIFMWYIISSTCTCFLAIIAFQSTTVERLKIMSCPKTGCPGVLLNVERCEAHTAAHATELRISPPQD